MISEPFYLLENGINNQPTYEIMQKTKTRIIATTIILPFHVLYNVNCAHEIAYKMCYFMCDVRSTFARS